MVLHPPPPPRAGVRRGGARWFVWFCGAGHDRVHGRAAPSATLCRRWLFQRGGGGGAIEPPKTGGGGLGKGLNGWEHQSLTMESGAKGAEKFFEH